MVDVARALGLSHAAVYRYFPTKAALQDAVTRQWLARVSKPLSRIVAAEGPAAARIRQWFHALAAVKRKKVLDDPDLFAAYSELATLSEGAVSDHVAELQSQVEAILQQGGASGEFAVAHPRQAAAVLFRATLLFHHPHHVMAAKGRYSRRDLDMILDAVLRGLCQS